MNWMRTTVRKRAATHRTESGAHVLAAFNDYSGPADGDFARYVDELMAAAQQRQVMSQPVSTRPEAVAHSVTLGRLAPDAAWGRGEASIAPARPQSNTVRAAPTSRPTAYDPLAKAQQPASAPLPPMPGHVQRKRANEEDAAANKAPAATTWVLFFMVVAVMMFVRPEALPILIIGWVGWSLWRQFRR